MRNAVKNISFADYYFDMLSNLNSEGKLDLISKLSQSLKKNNKNDSISLASLFGALKTEQTAEEIIEELRASRTFNRKIEPL